MTRNASVYELSDDHKWFRRVEGINPIHPALHKDGAWHAVKSCGTPTPKCSFHVLIKGWQHYLQTSRVVEIL